VYVSQFISMADNKIIGFVGNQMVYTASQIKNVNIHQFLSSIYQAMYNSIVIHQKHLCIYK